MNWCTMFFMSAKDFISHSNRQSSQSSHSKFKITPAFMRVDKLLINNPSFYTWIAYHSRYMTELQTLQLQNPPRISLYSYADLAHYPTFTTRSLKLITFNTLRWNYTCAITRLSILGLAGRQLNAMPVPQFLQFIYNNIYYLL